jgi:TRAP-type C4-dicarboxylate transport system permease small subunit
MNLKNKAVKKRSVVQTIITLFQRVEDGILIALLLVMIFMAVLQIALRNLFDSGILWGDPLVRILVLWIGLMGAMIASRNNHHISIDVISRYLPDRIKQVATLLVCAFTCLVCAVMTWYSFGFVMMERADKITAFAAIPAWICESIIPMAFAVISARYLLLSGITLVRLFRPGTP